MRNPLQEQLLKAGLAKKHKIAAAVREQNQQRQGKAPVPDQQERVSAERLQAERAERDRALAAEQKAQARAHELRAQIRQIVETHKLAAAGEIAYRFTHDTAIKTLWVSESQRRLLAKGALVIVQHDQGYVLLPRAAAELVHERNGPIVVDHGRAPEPAASEAEDSYYQRFVVPDDLTW